MAANDNWTFTKATPANVGYGPMIGKIGFKDLVTGVSHRLGTAYTLCNVQTFGTLMPPISVELLSRHRSIEQGELIGFYLIENLTIYGGHTSEYCAVLRVVSADYAQFVATYNRVYKVPDARAALEAGHEIVVFDQIDWPTVYATALALEEATS